MSDCLCSVKFNGTPSGSSKLFSGLSVQPNAQTNFNVEASLLGSTKMHGITHKFDSIISLKKPSLVISAQPTDNTAKNAFINASTTLVEGNILARNNGLINIKTGTVDKIGGHYSSLLDFQDFLSTKKIYPSGDLILSSGSNTIIKTLNHTDIIDSVNKVDHIDEGVFTGTFKQSFLVANEKQNIAISGDLSEQSTFKFKCFVDPPFPAMRESFLVIRAIAPLNSSSSNIPPLYKLSNLRFEDPSGNLISKYKDFDIVGDANTDIGDYRNYTTYISEPETNNAKLLTSDSNYPILNMSNGYTLNVDIDVLCRQDDDSFTQGFSIGYDQSCIPTGVNVHDTLNIAAIEILCSGGAVGISGIIDNGDLGVYIKSQEKGLRSVREILPSQVLSYNYDTTIYPSGEHSVWKNDSNVFNYDIKDELTQSIRSNDIGRFVELVSTSDVADSGKLKLKFSHEAPTFVFGLRDGEFNKQFGFGLKTAESKYFSEVDSFFQVEDIELKIIAKKAVGSRDFVVDAVGYSDDKLFHITPKIGGFLQNASGEHPSGIGILPVESGFAGVDDLGISTETFSDKFSYFESSGTNNEGGDHYSLPTLPLVNSTDFAEYTIPLKIYEDNVTLGQSTTYNDSSYFEHLYLDLFPFPSGAVVAKAYLSFTYKPSNAFTLNTIGHKPNDRPFHRSNFNALPSGSSDFPININSDITVSDSSLIENIPHGYKASDKESTLKTNYSRRWRGVDGEIVNGPFNPVQFGYGFYNPELETPFMSGFYDFTRVQDNFVLSNPIGAFAAGAASGFFNSDANASIIENIGLRFNSSGIFDTSQRPYKTLDWVQSDHELKGRISDSFDKAIRVSGVDGNINFGSGIPVSGGFSAYVRFSPDITISGSSYNLWNSGVLLSKWDSSKELEFALGYSNGYLRAYGRAVTGDIVTVTDDKHYTEYNYPIAALITYNDNQSSALKLYVDSDTFRDSGPATPGQGYIFKGATTTYGQDPANVDTSDIVVGHSHGSGIGINAFITEVGLGGYNASGANIVQANLATDDLNINPFFDDHSREMQQTPAYSFFRTLKVPFNSGNHPVSYDKRQYNFWHYTNEDVEKWHLGDFKICQFNHEFDRFTTRIGNDYVSFNLSHDGSGYTQRTNVSLPSGSINVSGLAYHSQIENDMLRFNLSMPRDQNSDRFYAVTPRISKDLPRGYKFEERGLVVDTIMENDIDNNVIWSDGKTGPKLIVSLYAPQYEDTSELARSNYGLVNRHSHYLEQSGCWQKLSSTFTYDNFIDNSEPWANFNSDVIQREKTETYYNFDLDKMFVQYDLSFPSGIAFRSNVKLHSVNLRAENSLASGVIIPESGFTFYVDGRTIRNQSIEFFVNGSVPVSGSFNLYASGDLAPLSSGSATLYSSGTNFLSLDPVNGSIPPLTLVTSTVEGVIGFNPSFGGMGQLFGHEPHIPTHNPAISLFIGGKLNLDIDSKMNLFTSNDIAPILPSGSLSLFSYSDGIIDIQQNQNLFIRGIDPEPTFDAQSMSLYTENIIQPVRDTNIDNMPLYVFGSRVVPSGEANLNLVTMSYAFLPNTDNAKNFINWTNQNVGTNILANETDYSYLDANDEIRGVDLTAFGSCSYNSEQATEVPITIHGETFGGECVEAGIFRPKRLYTNLATSGFKTDIGYSGNFYGIRKYTGLVPEAPYEMTIFGKSGGTSRKDIPKTISWEYGFNEDVGFSGIKLIADGISGASGVVGIPEASGRDYNDEYGASVKTNKDYLIVGSPYREVHDLNYPLGEAGSVFVYKRNPAPTGFDWSQQDDKSGFSLVTELAYPEGMRRDSKNRSVITTLNKGTSNERDLPFAAIQTKWTLNQEGRNLGYSIDISNSGDNTTIIAGAPNGRWSRRFEDPVPDSLQVALFVFASPFIQERTFRGRGGHLETQTWRDVLSVIQDHDLLYKFYCNPAVKIDPTIIVIEPVLSDRNSSPNEFIDPEANGKVFKFEINNHKRTDDNQTAGFQATDDIILEQLKQIFHGPESGVFKYDASKPNNNIPVIVSAMIDDSFSMGAGKLGSSFDRFKDWYAEYSLASGVTDIGGSPRSGATTEFINRSLGGERWIDLSNELLRETLDLDRMKNSRDFELFANFIGTFDSSAATFNIAPPSGGLVAIFEEENNNGVSGWNVIDEIFSPTVLNNNSVDRFGHAVAISDNAKIIAIGSPYINEAVQIWEKEYTDPRPFVGSWLSDVGSSDSSFGYLKSMLRTWQSIQSTSNSNIVANNSVYDQLTPSGKLQLRRDYNIHQYKLMKEYKHSDITPGGQWGWLFNKFAPTPRLGYSVAVNEDGSIVAAGAPTDSVLHDAIDGMSNLEVGTPIREIDLWWRPSTSYNGSTHIKSQWYNSVNAGSVTVFESRQYYPHDDKVVEFTIFGNKHRSVNIESQGSNLFDHMGQVFNDNNKTFTRLAESEVDLPNDAGLVFIITPEVDALSDEILDNIQDWLSLGDRHLVLVSDDPRFEGNGIYAQTNDIVNKILVGLDSRMTVIAARNVYESLIGSNRLDEQEFDENEPNIIPSFVPTNTTSTYVFRSDLYGSGVADIKLNYPGIYDPYTCSAQKDILAIPEVGDAPTYQSLNDKCNMIPQHGGDIRAQWNDHCENPRGLGYIVYPRNLAFSFGTATELTYSCCLGEGDCPPAPTLVNYEPIPLLTASEHVSFQKITPATPDEIVIEDIMGTQILTTDVFGDDPFEDAAFYWSSSSNNYKSLNFNLQPTSSPSKFITTADVAFNQTNILRGEANPEKEQLKTEVSIQPLVMSAKENYSDTSSEIILIGTTETEKRKFIFSGFSDRNVLFYDNLLYEVGSSTKRLKDFAFIADWTGTDSFLDAREESILDVLLDASIPSDGKLETITTFKFYVDNDHYQAAWIANPTLLDDNGDPISDTVFNREMGFIKEWLSTNNKKLYITLGRSSDDESFVSLDRIRAVEKIANSLGINIKPLLLPVRGKYSSASDFRLPNGSVADNPKITNRRNIFFSYSDLQGSVDLGNAYGNVTFNSIGFVGDIPIEHSTCIDITSGGTALFSSQARNNINTYSITDNFIEILDVPYLKTGVASVTFPVLPGSGYRVFIDTISANFNEKLQTNFLISNCDLRYGQQASGSITEIKDVIHIPGNEKHNEFRTVANDFIGARVPKTRREQNKYDINAFTPRQREFQFDGSVNHESINIYIPSGDGTNVINVNEITIYMDANKINYTLGDAQSLTHNPSTTRIVGISGALLPSDIKFTPVPIKVGEREVVIPGTLEFVTTVTESRPISTNSLKYCPSTECSGIFSERDPNSLIADGPIVAAQEVYHQRPFDAGVAKSRITVLTDASLIQGSRIANENGVLHNSVVDFLNSLYPETSFPDINQGNSYNVISRIKSPVQTSPQKLFNSTGNSGLMVRFAGDGTTPTSGLAMTNFSDDIDPAALRRGSVLKVLDIDVGESPLYILPVELPPPPEIVPFLKKAQIETFNQEQYTYGGTAKFSGIIDGTMYADAYYGQMPQLLKDKGYDYLDFDKLPSGYPGDLFGYSIALRDNKLVVGSPFAPFSSETATNWTDVSSNTPRYEAISGTITSYGGGAGSAFLFERGARSLSDYGIDGGNKPWNMTRKFRPESINVGQDIFDVELASGAEYLGNHSYSSGDLNHLTTVTDQFGYSIALHDDMLAIGAPGHDFGNYEEVIHNAFNIKAFSNGIDISSRKVFNVGSSGIRHKLSQGGSGVDTVLNNGAVFTFENGVSDWDNRTKDWNFVQKIVPQGYNARLQQTISASGSENDYFGKSIDFSRNSTVDSDYILVVGSPHHKFATSGNHTTFTMGLDTGAVYVSDGVLRTPEQTTANTGIFLQAKVYSNSGIDRSQTSNPDFISLEVHNSGGLDAKHSTSGVLYTNNAGELFLEVSGQDPSQRGFVVHRPFIQEITGKRFRGVPIDDRIFTFYTSGRPPEASGSMNLFAEVSQGRVLSSGLGLYASNVPDVVSGVFSGSGFNLYSSGVTTTSSP